MATTTKKTYSPNEQLPASVSGPIQQSIAKIQAGIDAFRSGSTGGGAVVGGRLVGSGGQDLGPANPADIQGAGSPRTTAEQPRPETTQISPSAEAPQALVDQVNQAQQQINQLAQQRGTTLTPDGRGGYTATPNAYKEQYRQGFDIAKQVGGDALQDVGGGVATTQAIMSALPKETQFQSTPNVDAFYLDDKNVTTQAQEIIDFLSPPSTQQMLIDGMKQIQSQQAQLSQDKFALMNLETVMSGTAEDIAKEIEASGGIGTQSLVVSLAVARNSTLLKQASFLQNKIAMQQDLIANSTQLLSFEKSMANTQFSQRLGVMQYVQQNNDRMRSAFKDTIETIQKTAGWAGVLAAYQNNPRQLGYVDSLYGGTGSVRRLASLPPPPLTPKEKLEARKTEADIANVYSQIEERKKKGVDDVKAQKKIENAAVKADVILTNVNTALGSVGAVTSGFFGGLSKNIPGTSAYNLNKTITTIKANIGFQELQAMREASPTGGALGQVAVQELEALQATLGSLDIGQTPEQLKTNLNAVKTHYTNWLNTVGYEVLPSGDIVQIIFE